MSTEIAIRGEVIERQRLDELADLVRSQHGEVGKALERGLRVAIEVGKALLEAKAILPKGAFLPWVEDDCGISYSSSRFYMRVAHYEHVLPAGINQKEAAEYIRGLPPVDGRALVGPYPVAIREEARRRRRNGESYNKIGDDLGVSWATVYKWCHPAWKGKKNKERAASRKRNLARLARREALRQEAQKAARLRGGSVAQSYSLMRKLAQELDASIAQYEVGDPLRKELSEALSHVHQSETHISRALGVDYGSWRGDKPRLGTKP